VGSANKTLNAARPSSIEKSVRASCAMPRHHVRVVGFAKRQEPWPIKIGVFVDVMATIMSNQQRERREPRREAHQHERTISLDHTYERPHDLRRRDAWGRNRINTTASLVQLGVAGARPYRRRILVGAVER
jgi:hypothetical protein